MSLDLNGKTYTGQGYNTQGWSVWSEVSGGIAAAFSYLTNRLIVGTGKKATTNRWNLAVPITATEDSACGCEGSLIGTNRAGIWLDFRPGATAAERADLYARLEALVTTAAVETNSNGLTQSFNL